MRSLESSRRDRRFPNLSRQFSRSPMEDFFNELQRDFFSPERWSSERFPEGVSSDFSPAVDIEESNGMYLITADLPGIKNEDIKIDINDRVLRISGERRREGRREGPEGGYTERSYGRFFRSFTLPEGIDPKKIEAHFEDGVLRVLLPKNEVQAPQEIKIQGGEHRGLLDRFFGSRESRESKEKAGEVRTERSPGERSRSSQEESRPN